MKTAIYAGSFAPITNGHMDIILTASKMFDKVIVAVANNIEKKTFISVDDRVKLIRECVQSIENVEADFFEGLTVDYAASKGAEYLIRGIRNSTDTEYELQLKEINSKLNPKIITVFLTSKTENNSISSSAIREILHYGGNISQFVPKPVKKYFDIKRGI